MSTDSPAPDLQLLADLHELLMLGAARWQVEPALRERAERGNRPVPTAQTIDAAYATLVDGWIADADQASADIHAYHIALRKHLLHRAQIINDYPTAARIAQDLAKLQDQYATTRAAVPMRQERIARLKARGPRLRAVK